MEDNSTEDPTLLQSYKGHKDIVNAVSFHPGLKSIASGSMDGSVFVWNIKNSNKVYKFFGHKG